MLHLGRVSSSSDLTVDADTDCYRRRNCEERLGLRWKAIIDATQYDRQGTREKTPTLIA